MIEINTVADGEVSTSPWKAPARRRLPADDDVRPTRSERHSMLGDEGFPFPPGGRRLAAAMIGAALACATPAFSATRSPVHHAASSEAKELQRETVDQRIQTLHKDLAITSEEESDWLKVAAVMRRNEATIRTMVEQRKQEIGHVSAVDDLLIYEKFNQAHLDGLKDLIASFQTLYQSMPDSQKTVADRVFHGFGRERPLHG